MEFKHISIMADECIKGLNIKEDGIYVDCTLGGGGHSSLYYKSFHQRVGYRYRSRYRCYQCCKG